MTYTQWKFIKFLSLMFVAIAPMIFAYFAARDEYPAQFIRIMVGVLIALGAITAVLADYLESKALMQQLKEESQQWLDEMMRRSNQDGAND